MGNFSVLTTILIVGLMVLICLGLFFFVGWTLLCGFVGLYSRWVAQSTAIAVFSDIMIVVLFIASTCIFLNGSLLFLLPTFVLGLLCFIRFSHYTDFHNSLPNEAYINSANEQHSRFKSSSLLKWIGIGFLLNYLMRDKDEDNYIVEEPIDVESDNSIDDGVDFIPENTVDDFDAFDT